MTIAALANDGDDDDDTLTPTVISGPANGSAVVNPDRTITYTPDADFSGTDTFTYRITDGALDDSATVTVTVSAANDAPVADDDAYAVAANTTLTVPAANGILGNDDDIDGATLQVTATPTRDTALSQSNLTARSSTNPTPASSAPMNSTTPSPTAL